MAVCAICGKRPGSGNNVSHSNRRTKRRWLPNTVKVRARMGGGVRRIVVCTSCLKAGKVLRA